MELKSIFNSWAKSVKPEYSKKQWLLSKWEMFEGIEWPAEKSEVMVRGLRNHLNLHPSDRLIELGCGGGWILNQLRPNVKEAYGLDFSLEMLGHARTICPSGSIVCGDIQQLPLKAELFDKVLCYYVLLNFVEDRDIEQSILEIWRILKKQGRALIGQLPDQTKSHLYDEAKKNYMLFHQQKTDLGQNTAAVLPPPIKLFDKLKLERFLKQQGIPFRMVPSFNPFYYSGQPETVEWRFDLVIEKPS